MSYKESPYQRNDKKRVIGGKYKWRISGVNMITPFFFFFVTQFFSINWFEQLILKNSFNTSTAEINQSPFILKILQRKYLINIQF